MSMLSTDDLLDYNESLNISYASSKDSYTAKNHKDFSWCCHWTVLCNCTACCTQRHQPPLSDLNIWSHQARTFPCMCPICESIIYTDKLHQHFCSGWQIDQRLWTEKARPHVFFIINFLYVTPFWNISCQPGSTHSKCATAIQAVQELEITPLSTFHFLSPLLLPSLACFPWSQCYIVHFPFPLLHSFLYCLSLSHIHEHLSSVLHFHRHIV